MKFSIKTNEHPLGLGRLLGYKLLGEKDNEFNLVRPIGENYYPRFHMYAEKLKGELIFNLHLDQKRPIYEGQTAHSGEYEGEIIEREAERIKKLLENSGRNSRPKNIFLK